MSVKEFTGGRVAGPEPLSGIQKFQNVERQNPV